MREQVQEMLDQIAELATELGAEADEDGMIDVEALSSSDDPQLAALGAAGVALLDLHDALPEDEPQDSPEGAAEAMPPE